MERNRCEAFANVLQNYLVSNYPLKVDNRNSRTRCEICSKLSIKTPERCQWRSSISINNFEQLNTGWVGALKFTGK